MKDLLLTTALVSLIAAAPIYAQTTTGTDDTTGGAATGTDTGTSNDTTGTDAQTDTPLIDDTATDGTTTEGTSSTTDTTTTGTATDMGTDMGATAAITPPEGYTAYDTMALTSEDLQGATIYDANGESVGEITELVMAATTTADPAATDMSENSTGTDATGEAVDGTGMADAPTASTTTDGTAAGDMGASVNVDGQVSHVVLDVGGFLGIGARSVAVPMEALQVFRDANEEVRVYLPWTQAQLEALPEYDAADPTTLGNMGATGTMGSDTQMEGSETNSGGTLGGEADSSGGAPAGSGSSDSMGGNDTMDGAAEDGTTTGGATDGSTDGTATDGSMDGSAVDGTATGGSTGD